MNIAMKKIIVLIIIVCNYSVNYAQIVDIPDANFKFTLVNYPCVDTNGDGFGDSDADTNNDGEIQVSEAENVQGLYFTNNNIESFEGIQSFTNLLVLFFSCDSIINFDLTQNILLETLTFAGDNVSSINLSQNINLLELQINSNTQITELDLTNNPQLLILNCGYNPITTIDISQNINLTSLACYNTVITEIDLSGNPNLEYVFLKDNQLTSLDITNNPNLIEVDCHNNQITSLNVSQNPNLVDLFCSENQITSLDISENSFINRVTCENNLLSSLNLKNDNNIIITKMWAHDNPNLTCIQIDDINYPSSQVCTSSNGWCKDETAIYSEDCSLGIGDILATQITIYPNPIQDMLIIANNSTTKISTIKIYDVLGRELLISKGDIKQLDVSTLSSGILFVQIETDEGGLINKVVKE